MTELRSQMKVVESRKVSVETDYKNKYEGILMEKLNELRESHEVDMQTFRDETDTLYKSKVLTASGGGQQYQFAHVHRVSGHLW